MESQQTHLLVSLENNLNCPICLEIFTEPATSSCGKHNYCLECLKKHCEKKGRTCPQCREEFHKDYKPQRNITLCEIVKIVLRRTSEDTGSYENSFLIENPEVTDRIEHNLETLKRRLTHVTSEVEWLDHILSKKRKTKQQSKQVTSPSNDFVILGTNGHLSEGKNAPEYVPSELPEERLDEMTNSVRLGLECLTSVLRRLEQLDTPFQNVNTGQNVGDSLQEIVIPAEPSPVALRQQDGEQTPERPVTLLQLEGGQSQSDSDAQGVSMELNTGAEEAGPSAGLNDWLERLSFSPELAHRNLIFSDQNRRVEVRNRRFGRASPSRPERFKMSQVMAEQEFSGGVHYWEVEVSPDGGWAVGVAYPTLGESEKLGHTPSSWCLEWGSSKLQFWHSGNSEHIKHGCPRKVRIMLDMEHGSLAFYSPTDNMLLLYSVEVQFTSPVRPAFWLYGLKPGNSLTLVS